MKQHSITLDKEASEKLQKMANRTDRSESAIVRLAVKEYWKVHGGEKNGK